MTPTAAPTTDQRLQVLPRTDPSGKCATDILSSFINFAHLGYRKVAFIPRIVRRLGYPVQGEKPQIAKVVKMFAKAAIKIAANAT